MEKTIHRDVKHLGIISYGKKTYAKVDFPNLSNILQVEYSYTRFKFFVIIDKQSIAT
jgi:hypothetical protein